jgi:hypothetical protein
LAFAAIAHGSSWHFSDLRRYPLSRRCQRRSGHQNAPDPSAHLSDGMLAPRTKNRQPLTVHGKLFNPREPLILRNPTRTWRVLNLKICWRFIRGRPQHASNQVTALELTVCASHHKRSLDARLIDSEHQEKSGIRGLCERALAARSDYLVRGPYIAIHSSVVAHGRGTRIYGSPCASAASLSSV